MAFQSFKININKKMKSNLRRIVQYCFILGGISVVMSSCSEKDQEEITATVEGTVLSVRVEGIADAREIALSASNGRTAVGLQTAVIAKEKMVSVDGFDAVVSVEKQALLEGDGISSGARAAASTTAVATKASTTKMRNGIEYRLVIYDAADVDHQHAPKANVVLKSGVTPTLPISVDANKTYNWYAFSTNSAGTVPDVKNGVVDKAGLKNKDVVWANGTLTTQAGVNNLAITFNRNTARVQVVVNTLGVSGIMSGVPQLELLAGTNGVLKYGDLNIFNGEYQNATAFIVDDISGSQTPAPRAYQNTFTLHTIDNSTVIAANTLKAKLGNFNVRRFDFNAPNNSNYPGSALINFKSPTVALKNDSEFTFVKSHAYKVDIKLVESAVNVAGVQWARSNVKGYDANLYEGNSVFFMADPMNNVDHGFETFYWSNLPQDICQKVFPAGTWRLPTKGDFEKLRNVASNTVFLASTLSNNDLSGKGIGNGFLGIQYADENTVINSGYPIYAQKLTLPMAGYHDFGITSGYNISNPSTKRQIEAGYWTKDGATFGKQYFHTNGGYVYTGSETPPAITWGGNITPPVGQRFSVRCVRN